MTVATDTEQQADENKNLVKMTGHDRCDRCGAQAYVEAANTTLQTTLLFCSHHSNAHRDALEAQGFILRDSIDREHIR